MSAQLVAACSPVQCCKMQDLRTSLTNLASCLAKQSNKQEAIINNGARKLHNTFREAQKSRSKEAMTETKVIQKNKSKEAEQQTCGKAQKHKFKKQKQKREIRKARKSITSKAALSMQIGTFLGSSGQQG